MKQIIGYVGLTIAVAIVIYGCWGEMAPLKVQLTGEDYRKEIVQLQLDRDEIKLHTDQLAEIVKTQQYQIDVLTETISKDEKAEQENHSFSTHVSCTN